MDGLHKNNNGKGTLLVTAVSDPTVLGSITMKGNRIIKFSEKTKQSKTSNLINAGVYLLDPEVCELVTPETASIEQEIFPILAEENKLFGYSLDKDWIHLHDKEKYEIYLNSTKLL